MVNNVQNLIEGLHTLSDYEVTIVEGFGNKLITTVYGEVPAEEANVLKQNGWTHKSTKYYDYWIFEAE